MNKKRVDRWIPLAAEALRSTGIVQGEKINPSFRGKIATFGAAVSGGSLRAALLFFSQDGRAQVERSKLVDAMFFMLRKDDPAFPENVQAFLNQGEADHRTQEKFLDAAIAIKLAINLFMPDEAVVSPVRPQNQHLQTAASGQIHHSQGQPGNPSHKSYGQQKRGRNHGPRKGGSHA